ncbi:MAG: LamG domain-containing protein [Cellvibrionaceae bacterium]
MYKKIDHLSMIRGLKLLMLTSIAVGLLSGFTSCSSGSGSDGDTNVNAGGGGGSAGLTYSGPAPLSTDVQEFKLNVWDNLVADNRCGGCHKQGGAGTTSFVRDDDINAAYQAALSVADLEVPANSTLVQRMAQGHNCWDSSNNVCATLMEQYIQRWADSTTAAATVVTIQPIAPLTDPGASLNFPTTSTDFETLIHTPILRPYCGRCHSEDGSQRRQQPYFASSDVSAAYDAVRSKIDLNNPSNSRLVYRLAIEPHNNCWDPNDAGGPVNCPSNATEMESAITAFVNTLGAPDQVDTDALRVSKALSFPASPDQGQSANSGGRFESNIIAKYEFKQLDPNDPDRIVDTSGVAPQLDLTRSGDARFVSSWGMEFFGPTGRAQGRTSNSVKLYDLITLTGEFSIEAWAIPANVTQDNIRRIIAYSGGESERNFTLGQTLYDYDTLVRTTSVDSNPNGAPLYSTPNADEVLQASLQHVVVNFDPINGRSIYVNGELVTSDPDLLAGSNLSNWNNAFVLVLGNETVNNDLDWRGTLRFAAVHNRVLTPEQIAANFNVGVGQKYYMPFSISHLVNIPDAYIVFEVERFDDYSYLFNEPFFTVLDPNAVLPSDIQIQGMRIGINGREATTGQAYAKMDITITDTAYQAAENNWLRLSDLGIPVAGTIIQSEKILPETDEFFLSFEAIAGLTSSVDRSTPDYPNVSLGSIAYEQSDIGLKHFYEIDEMFSFVTGVPKDNSIVAASFAQLKTQLPSSEDPIGFATSNQMGIAQFSASYCEALATDSSLRSAMWPAVNFTQRLNDQRAALLDPLLQKLAAHRIGGGAHLITQADPADVEADIDTLLTALSTAQTGNQANGEATAIAVCTAVFSSAIATIQ